MAVLGSKENPVVLAYVKIKQPGKKYQSEELEWSVDCVVDEKTAKAWKKKFKKQPPKEHDNAEFKKLFKIDPPFPDQEEQFVIKLKKATHYKDKNTGKLKPFEGKLRPRLLLDTGAEKGGKAVLSDITFEKLVSNGSKGVVQYDIVENTYGVFAKLRAVRVDDLIEYEEAGFDELGELDDLASGGNVDDGFDEEEESGEEDDAPFDPDEDPSDY